MSCHVIDSLGSDPRGLTPNPSENDTPRSATEVNADQAPFARIAWGLVLLLLGVDWSLRRRIVRTPSAIP